MRRSPLRLRDLDPSDSYTWLIQHCPLMFRPVRSIQNGQRLWFAHAKYNKCIYKHTHRVGFCSRNGLQEFGFAVHVCCSGLLTHMHSWKSCLSTIHLVSTEPLRKPPVIVTVGIHDRLLELMEWGKNTFSNKLTCSIMNWATVEALLSFVEMCVCVLVYCSPMHILYCMAVVSVCMCVCTTDSIRVHN